MTDNLQHCSNARSIMSSIGPIIHQASSARDQKKAAVAVSTEYMKKACGMNQPTVDALSKDELIANLQKALMQSVFQLNAVNEVSQDSRN